MLDVHSHKKIGENVVHNVSPKEWQEFANKHPQQLVSIGIHPWHIEQRSLEEELALLSSIIENELVFAIGETGLDKRCNVPLNLQKQSLNFHIQLSEKYQKPLILHCVGAYNELQLLKRKVSPSQRWIIHGFRGNPFLAKQLMKEGFYFSIGWSFNPETIKILPKELLYFETDESDATIEQVYEKVISIKGNINI